MLSKALTEEQIYAIFVAADLGDGQMRAACRVVGEDRTAVLSAMTRIVRTAYGYKRPARKKAVALEGPVIVRAANPAKARRRARAALPESTPAAPAVVSPSIKRAGASAVPAPDDDRKPAETAKRSAIVTARKPGKRYADVPDVTEEEHRRVGDRADAMMQEFKRKIAEKELRNP